MSVNAFEGVNRYIREACTIQSLGFHLVVVGRGSAVRTDESDALGIIYTHRHQRPITSFALFRWT